MKKSTIALIVAAVVCLGLSAFSAKASVTRTNEAIEEIGEVTYSEDCKAKIDRAVEYYNALDKNLDLQEKVNPYLRPLYDALQDTLGTETYKKMMEKNIIEAAPLAYMRGRTLERVFAILDEAQNTTGRQMKMFLTRLGFGSKMVVNGDLSQIDLPRGVKSGLTEAVNILQNIKGIGCVEFDDTDVIRHDVVARIVRAYDAYEAAEMINKTDRITENKRENLN